MSRTYRLLLVAIVALGAVGGYWKLALAPKREQIAHLDEQVLAERAQLAQTQQLIATYQGARDEYKTNYDTVVRLGKAVPTDDDSRSLVVQLDAAAKRSGIDFDTLNVSGGGGGTAGSSDGAATNIIPGAINAGNFSAMPFTLNFTGEFSTLGDFFSRLERFVSVKGDQVAVSGRLLRIESISLQPGSDGWPGLTAQVGASSYIVPKATDPAAAAAASTATAASSAATTTTTTSTGNDVR